MPARNIDEYIAAYPEDVQVKLQKIRELIRECAPAAEENMGYGLPTFRMNKNLVYFAAFKNHIGFYPGASIIEEFREELQGYSYAKGSIQFPYDKPIPYGLIRQIIEFRVALEMESQR